MSNVKIQVPILSLCSRRFYALLDDVDSDDEKEVDNLMNDSDVDLWLGNLLGNYKVISQKAGTHKNDDSNVNTFIPTTKSTEALVQVAKSDYKSVDDSDDVPLSNLTSKNFVFRC